MNQRRRSSEESNCGNKLAEDSNFDLQRSISGVLLANQIERLNEIAIETALASDDADQFVERRLEAHGLGIDPGLQRRYQQKVKSAQRDVEEQVTKLRLEAWRKLLSELDNDDRKSVHERVKVPAK